MFQESDKILLRDRLGWSEFEQEVYAQKLDATNLNKTSGFTLNSFHGLVTLENVYNCISDSNITDNRFNSVLTEMLDNVVLDILTDVFVSDSRSKTLEDSSSLIVQYGETGLFDKAIGYCHAIKVLELILSSVRSNRIELITKENAAQIHSIISGIYNSQGKLIIDGLVHKCSGQRELIKSKIFGFSSNTIIYDATNEW